MLNDLSGKIGKLKLPEESLLKKLERIKRTAEIDTGRSLSLSPDIMEQIRQTPEEMTKKIEEMVNSKAEQIKANTEAVKNIESQLTKIDQILSSKSKGSSDELKERLDKMDETLLELLSLYEVVSSTVNPFVEAKLDGPTAEKIEGIEKKVKELSEKTQGVPSNLSGEIDTKFKTIETTLGELKNKVESNVIDENALVEKVTEQVIDRIKPQGKQKNKPHTVSSPAKSTLEPAQSAQYVEEDDTEVKLPYLDNRPETSIILLNWLEFLMEKVGRNNLYDVLDYYVEIGWISEEVNSKMMSYASGIDYYVERPTWKLLPEDHTKSLLFIEQLKGRKIDKNLLSRLERDLDKVVRGGEVLVY